VGRSIVANVPRAAIECVRPQSVHAFVDREDAIPVVIDASRQAQPPYPVRALAAHPAK
jgi:hypothetical protein